MKPLLLLFLLLSLFPAFAQDTPSPDASASSLSSQDAMLKKRAETVKKLRTLMENPSTSAEMKLKLAAAALDLLDQDTDLLQADHDLLVSTQKALASQPTPTAPKPHHHDQPPDARTSGLPAN